MRRVFPILLVIVALAAWPLLVHGPSCGHDFVFHLQSWMEAADQFRHGTLQPHWAFSAAYNAGEPRFVFYPPLSWTVGALLTMLLPVKVVPVVFTLLALAGAAGTMFLCARAALRRDAQSATGAALLAAAVYISAPYTLFNALERTAYAELLAAVWFPLLFRELLRERLCAWRIAVPVALLWLTNAPAGVMGCYTLAFMLLVRMAAVAWQDRGRGQAAVFRDVARRLLLPASLGVAWGLALAAFYLVPAAYERRWVQIEMAVIPNMRVVDNFLFARTGDGPHDAVLHSVSLLAVALVVATAAAVVLLLAVRGRAAGEPVAAEASRQRVPLHVMLAALAAALALMLFRISAPLWNHLPELAFLQFPWRFLSVLDAVLALACGGLAVALLPRRARSLPLCAALAVVCVSGLSLVGEREYRQGCEARDVPGYRQLRFTQHLGVEPTDEYTPTAADNDVLRADDPPFWLAADPQAFAPGTTPNPESHAAGQRNVEATEPATAPKAAATPLDLHLDVPAPEYLILNLRNFPAWRITLNGQPVPFSAAVAREDGLVALPLRAGASDVHIRWQRTPDQWTGWCITGLGLAGFGILPLRARSRRIDHNA